MNKYQAARLRAYELLERLHADTWHLYTITPRHEQARIADTVAVFLNSIRLDGLRLHRLAERTCNEPMDDHESDKVYAAMDRAEESIKRQVEGLIKYLRAGREGAISEATITVNRDPRGAPFTLTLRDSAGFGWTYWGQP